MLLTTNIDQLVQIIRDLGPMGPIVFMITIALAIIVSPIPSLPLDVAAGIVWGPELATLYAVIGAQIGALIAFTLARLLGREVIEKKLHKKVLFWEGCSQKTVGWAIFGSRLLPIFQFDIVSYGAGLTKVSYKTFAIATFFGMIPATYFFALTGHTYMASPALGIILSLVLITGMLVTPYILKKMKTSKSKV